MRRTLLMICAALLILTTTAGAGGYVVYLKNGKFIRAKEPMQIKGSQAIIVLVTGTMASYPVDYIDVVKTERYNQLGLGDAAVIDELTVAGDMRPTPTPTPSLGGMATLNIGEDGMLTSYAPPTPTPTPGIRLHSFPYHDSRVTSAFQQILDDRKLYIYRTSAGTQPDYFFVQTVTDQQREVFAALNTVTEALTLIHELHPEICPDAVELEMISTAGKPAGTFRITPEMAQLLHSQSMSVEQFYVTYVIF
jgi:hypothetical protein